MRDRATHTPALWRKCAHWHLAQSGGLAPRSVVVRQIRHAIEALLPANRMALLGSQVQLGARGSTPPDLDLEVAAVVAVEPCHQPVA